MRSSHVFILSFVLLVLVRSAQASPASLQSACTRAEVALADRMDAYHLAWDVYTDIGSPGNHCPVYGFMPEWGAGLITIDACCQERPHSGATCMECAFAPRYGDDWAGVYYMNGVLPSDSGSPQANWGTVPKAGFDLTGATKVVWWARGARGGERVQFLVGGVGSNGQPYPESFGPIRTPYITLSSQWRRYEIDLRGQDLSYVLAGFGWVTNAPQNVGKSITFYLDDISWDLPRLDDPRFVVSYETAASQDDFDVAMRNVAFTYDNAVYLLALLASDVPEARQRARLLADALAYAADHDRFYDDHRLRNAYSAGDLVLFPGWLPRGRADTVRMSGIWLCDDSRWVEDKFTVSTHTGNVAWPIIALVRAARTLGDSRYLDAALAMARWVVDSCYDTRGAGGFTGGYQGWEPSPTRLLYKSTEHNIDLVAAFSALARATGDDTWQQHANYARAFVNAMWDDQQGKFWTGTQKDGVSFNTQVVPLDCQAWGAMLLGPQDPRAARALQYAETHHAVGGGYDFNEDRDGVWYEGTCHMAAAYRQLGQSARATHLLSQVAAAQDASGLIPAASKDNLTTGFDWRYFHRGHVGATAWLLLAARGQNPLAPGMPPLPGDLDGDGAVNLSDIAQLIVYWRAWRSGNPPAYDAAYDLAPYQGQPPAIIPNPDGKITRADATALLAVYLALQIPDLCRPTQILKTFPPSGLRASRIAR